MSKIYQYNGQGVSGFYAESDRGTIALIAQDGVGPFLALWNKEPGGDFPVAIGLNEEGQGTLVIPGCSQYPRVVTLDSLINALTNVPAPRILTRPPTISPDPILPP